MKIEINKLKNSEVEIVGSIPFEKLEIHRKEAIKNIGQNIKLDGFRPGHIPEKVLIEKIGEMTILHEMAEIALQYAYPDILITNKIDAITSPEITITKIAANNPLEFKIKVAVMPVFDLPEYKKIAKKENEKEGEVVDVTDEEVEKVVKQILTAQDSHAEHQHDESGACVKTEETEKELTDEVVKKLGDFKDVSDFKAKLKEDIKKQKEHQQREKNRLQILEKLVENSKIELPEILVEAELRKMMAEMSDNISRMGLKFDKYLEHIKKTEDDLKKEWRSDAEKRVKIQLILNKIAITEKTEISDDEVDKNVEAIMSQHKEAKKENVEIYVRMMLMNEAVLKLLEEQK